MIHYQLQCSRDHGFDGWFKDSAAFEAQARRGLLECPVCGDIKVDRALMAPAVPKKGRPFRAPEAAPAAAPAEPPAQPVAVAPERLPDHVRALLQRMRAEVEKHCDYVGDNFADEARRITPARARRAASTAKPPPTRPRRWRRTASRSPASPGCRARTGRGRDAQYP